MWYAPPGEWDIAIAEADPQSHITAQDFPGVLDVTREYVRRHEVTEQYSYLPGELKTLEFGENRYDLAILGNIVHLEGERSSRTLFKKLFKALKSKGRIVIADIIPNDDRTEAEWPLLFAPNMLVNT
jgi:ubiquinone/menaquinone biosynthesis C-methylase UbiE